MQCELKNDYDMIATQFKSLPSSGVNPEEQSSIELAIKK